MVDAEAKRRMVKLARQGKTEGEGGLRMVLTDMHRLGFTGEFLDFSEKPYFRSALWEASWRNQEVAVKLLLEPPPVLA